MVEAAPLNEVETALYSRLTGTAMLTPLLATQTSVYHSIAPQGAAYPLVIVNRQAGSDDNKSPRRARQLLYLVKAVSNKSMKEAGAIDKEIDKALHDQALSITGWSNYWLMRETDVQYVEVAEDDRVYYHSGGIYRMRIAHA